MAETATATQRLAISDNTHRDLKLTAIISGKTLFQATEEAVREWVQKHKSPSKRQH